MLIQSINTHIAQQLLEHMSRTSPTFRHTPANYLEIRNKDGSTPLIVACQKGYYQIAELLLYYGASIHAQNRRSDGGTALHEAVNKRNGHLIDLLLSKGANAFVENINNATAMDFACEKKNLALMRRFEDAAPWKGWLEQKVSALAGFTSQWRRRWVVICFRMPSPFVPVDKRRTHLTLLCYVDQERPWPSCKAWLDGANAYENQKPSALERTRGRRPAQVEVKLHRRHREPSGCHATGGPMVGGYSIRFRPDEGTLQGCENLSRFMHTINYPRAPYTQTTANIPSQPAAAVPPSTPTTVRPPLSDAELARRLQQEEEDALYAAQLAGGRVGGGVAGGVGCANSTPSISPMPSAQSIPSAQSSSFTNQHHASTPTTTATPPQNGAPATTTTPSSSVLGDQEGSLDHCCVICQDNEAVWVLVHGDISHRAFCQECKDMFQERGETRCPRCRQPIEAYTKVV